jgi:hypothetical protein
MRIGRVAELFQIPGRGVTVITDTSWGDLPVDLRLKIGDPIEIRTGDSAIFRTVVAGIERFSPYTTRTKFSILLPQDVCKDSVPIDSELWTTV